MIPTGVSKAVTQEQWQYEVCAATHLQGLIMTKKTKWQRGQKTAPAGGCQGGGAPNCEFMLGQAAEKGDSWIQD